MGIVRTRWIGLVALLAAEAMNLLDATVVQVIGPTMHAAFGGPAATCSGSARPTPCRSRCC